MSTFIQCILQEDAENYYLFNDTGIKVYSLEEMLYHCLNYWEQSIYDYINGNLEQWISDELKLPHIASNLQSTRNSQMSLTEQYKKVLLITDYYSSHDIEDTMNKLLAWENRTQWEKLKEKGDAALRENKYQKAVTYYTEALNYVDEIGIYNNLSIAYSLMENYTEAENILIDAFTKSPENKKIFLNLIELYKVQNKCQKIIELLASVKDKNISFIQVIYGDVEVLQGNKSEAIKYYTTAIKLGDDYQAYIKLAELYIKDKDFSKARKILNQCPDKNNSKYLLELSKIYDLSGDTKSAIQKMLQALPYEKDNAKIWVRLSQLYLKIDEPQKAWSAVSQAVNISPDDDEVQLTLAKINKEQNKTEDYRNILSRIIDKWKIKFRDSQKN